ncbi:hypothetical protein TNCV_3644121 [Trichonephila clavipes]|nr:hypothetical protein TNCV_3644121 [Trichonephila clavipes]
MPSFLVLREGDNRNRWRDGQVCPDVGLGIMAPRTRQPCVSRRLGVMMVERGDRRKHSVSDRGRIVKSSGRLFK